ncbi:MAG: hypothetical protein Q9217_000992 [Psora testacea]
MLEPKAPKDTVGDRVLLRYKDSAHLTKPLHPEGRTATHLGDFYHGDIIGKQSRDIIKSHKGSEVRVHVPTLAEYVTLTPRIVTPVYPADANLIVSLLDIHISDVPTNRDVPKLEVLEAGTGHGALTLYLARAIHAINPVAHAGDPSEGNVLGASPSDAVRESSVIQKRQRAIVHTIDVSPTYSEQARRTVKGFRQGMYADNIEFYVGDVSRWIDEQVQLRALKSAKDKTFLSHIILDMPNAERHVARAASVLHTDGNLLIFNPSISQIMAIVDVVKREYLPLQLDTVFELGPGLTGGREWDVRSVVPRAQLRAENKGKAAAPKVDDKSTDGASDENDGVSEHESSGGEELPSIQQDNQSLRMVCRPKVGGRIKGGGFVGVWKKMKDKY